MASAFAGERTRPTTRPRRPQLLAGAAARAATRCSSRARAASASSGRRRYARAERPAWAGTGADASSGAGAGGAEWAAILIGGTAALLICIFLSPKFIEFLREREFGQHIREDGPEGHHQKAGTPTMGGIIIFLAVRSRS